MPGAARPATAAPDAGPSVPHAPASGKLTMRAPAACPNVPGMQQIPTSERMRVLERRQQQLEMHLRRCRAAADESDAPNPSLGRVLDDTTSSLAKVRSELSRLGRR
jgi:hypothetical protein